MSHVLRKPSKTRRLEIAEAAIQLAGQRGASALTAAAIAGEVGLTSGALFRHFDSIDAILSAAVERAREWVLDGFPDQDLPPLERLENLITNRVNLLGERPGLLWLLLSDQAAARLPEVARKRLGELAVMTRTSLAGAIEEARAREELRCDISAEAQLTTLIGAVHALARRGQMTPDSLAVLGDIFKLLRPIANH